VSESEYRTIVTSVEGPLGIIEMNQPEKMNPLNPETSEREMNQALLEFHADRAVRVVILTGRGRGFCAGADLKENHRSADDPDEESAYGRRLFYGYDYGLFWDTLHHYRKPLVAAVNGYALGGGWELAHLCDWIVADESAKFGAVEINVGQNPFAMTPTYLTKMLGKHRAIDLMVNATIVTADECLAAGMVNAVVPDGQCLAAARELALKIAARPPLTVAAIKQLVVKAAAADQDHQLERALAYFLKTTDDARAAWQATAAKQPLPEFQGR
jgi:enoyl-CoA hydratase/carnithine racemase